MHTHLHPHRALNLDKFGLLQVAACFDGVAAAAAERLGCLADQNGGEDQQTRTCGNRFGDDQETSG